jgi:hypothetical protein
MTARLDWTVHRRTASHCRKIETAAGLAADLPGCEAGSAGEDVAATGRLCGCGQLASGETHEPQCHQRRTAGQCHAHNTSGQPGE